MKHDPEFRAGVQSYERPPGPPPPTVKIYFSEPP